MKPHQMIKTQQQADASWKAWVGGTGLVVYAKTKVKAIDVVKIVLGDREEGQTKDFDAPLTST